MKQLVDLLPIHTDKDNLVASAEEKSSLTYICVLTLFANSQFSFFFLCLRQHV